MSATIGFEEGRKSPASLRRPQGFLYKWLVNGLIYRQAATGVSNVWVLEDAATTLADTIYTKDSALTSPRTVTQASNDLTFSTTGNTNALKIEGSSGFVGFGRSNPGFNADILGTFSYQATTGGNGKVFLGSNNGWGKMSIQGGGGAFIMLQDGTYNLLSTTAGTSGDIRMSQDLNAHFTLNKAGRVKIGTQLVTTAATTIDAKLHVKGEGVGSGLVLKTTDSIDSETFRVYDDSTVLIGRETGTNNANVEINGAGNGTLLLYQDGIQSVFARLNYFRAEIGATLARVRGADQIGYAFQNRAIQTNNGARTVQFNSSQIPQMPDGTFACADIRFGGNLKIRNDAAGSQGSRNASRLEIQSSLERNIANYNPIGDPQFEVDGIGVGGWLLFLNNTSANIDTDSAASSTVSEYNIAKIERIGIDSVNGGVGTEVTYTTGASLRIDGAPIATTDKTVITDPYALYVAQDETYLGGNVTLGNLPISSVGLPAGALWNNAGVVNIV